MKTRILQSIVFIITCGAYFGLTEIATANDLILRTQWTSDTNSEIFNWNGSCKTKGFQWFSTEKIGFSSVYSNDVTLDMALKTGCVISQSNSAGLTGTVSSFVDTTFHSMVAYDVFEDWQPFLSFDMNVPTGKATLFGNEKNAIMDRDLVSQTRFGEGANFNPGIGVTIPLSKRLISSVAVGYNFRGAYVPDGDSGYLYNPGNQFIATFGLNYLYDSWLVALNAIYINERQSSLGGLPYFKPGDSYTKTGLLAYKWTPRNTTKFSVAINSVKKNQITDFFSGGYVNEEKNSNSTVYIVSLAHTLDANDRLSYTVSASYLLRDKNQYEPQSDFFISAKKKLSTELNLQYKYNNKITATIGAGVFELNQDSTPYLDAQHYFGVNGNANIKILL